MTNPDVIERTPPNESGEQTERGFDTGAAPAYVPARLNADRVGVVGSPSSTSEITMDVVESASGSALLGDLVATAHPLDGGRHLLALGTVGEIETRNRWHEDPNMRGVLRVHGSLPHLSAHGDVRTAKIQVQAVYEADQARPPFDEPPRESGGSLGMSPTTGQSVRRVDEDLVQALVARHASEVVYLGRVYRSSVRLPMFVRHFATPATDGAFHTGIFGRSGSGKTALATYLLAIQMRHPELGVFVFDPQGQFTSESDLVLSLQEVARGYGRKVRTLSIAEDIRLPKDAGLLLELLDDTGFFRVLTLKTNNENRESAREELARLLRADDSWENRSSDELLRNLLQQLVDDDRALLRIYSSKNPRDRLTGAIQMLLDDASEFALLSREFAPVHALFTEHNPNNGRRMPLEALIHQVIDTATLPKPLVIVDLSRRLSTPWLGDPETQARLIRRIASVLARVAEERWRASGRLINCSVVFDEAARFAPAAPTGAQVAALSAKLVEYVRETRKTGIGWTFITQEAHSLSSGIYAQLSIRAYGYGLTSGADLNRLRDEVGSGTALELYKSFADPKALSEKAYPFMLTGPVSPLSFTAAPVYLEVFTEPGRFWDANRHHLPVGPLLPQGRG